jgi:four helix bundle protein
VGSIESYKDLIVWQKSMQLVKMTYQLTKDFPKEEMFGLTSQIKRSSVSIPSNIAEGWGRFSRKDYVRFLRISRGSLFEFETQLILSKELDFIKDIASTQLLITEVGKMLNTMIKKLESKETV